MNVIGYLRVSTAEQGDSGLGLEAQRNAIVHAAESRGWTILRFEEDIATGTKVNGRPGLHRAIESCKAGDANAIVVAKLDRLVRSAPAWYALLADAKEHGFDLVVLDIGFDTTNPI